MQSLAFRSIFCWFFLLTATSAQGICSNANDFLCTDGGCISRNFLCDGSKECHDGSDETRDLCLFRACSQSLDYEETDAFDIFAVPNLGKGQVFRCDYGACISQRFVCDGIRHCVADGSDETPELCLDRTCSNQKFRCNYGACIFSRSICDNRYHCFDHSDESADACKKKTRSCLPSRHFKCNYGACIRKAKRCNGVIDCLDSSDEWDDTCGPRPDLPRPLRSSFSSSVKLIGSPQATTAAPVVKPPSSTVGVSPADQKGCQLTGSLEVELEIASCGDSGYCDDDVLPVNTLMIIFCGGNPTPLRCKDDKKWYFEKEPLRAPRTRPCGDAEEPSGPPGTSVDIHPKAKVPLECGNLPPFQPNPWLVGLFRGGNFACTGTIIASSLILTAGHCVVEPESSTTPMAANQLKIQYNSKNPNDPRQWASVSVIEIHPNYSGGPAPRFDMALLFLKEEVGSSAACFDREGVLLNIPAWTFNRTMGQNAYSWQLFQQTFNPACYNLATACTRHLEIGSNQFCGYNKDSELHLHRGSSGGPYLAEDCSSGVAKWRVVGVTSNQIATSGCGLPHTIFSQVSKFHAWITRCGFEGDCRA